MNEFSYLKYVEKSLILINIPYAHEKNVYSAVVGCQ